MPRHATAPMENAQAVIDEIAALQRKVEMHKDQLRAKRAALMAEVSAIEVALENLGERADEAPKRAPAPRKSGGGPSLREPAVAAAPSPGGDRIVDELKELAPWLPGLRDNQRKIIGMRLTGMSTPQIAAKIGSTMKDISNAVYAGRARLRELRTRGAPAEKPANDSDEDPEPAAPASDRVVRLRAIFEAHRPRFANLSPRRRQVVDLFLAGRSVREIADELGVAFGTAQAALTEARWRLDRGDGQPPVRFETVGENEQKVSDSIAWEQLGADGVGFVGPSSDDRENEEDDFTDPSLVPGDLVTVEPITGAVPAVLHAWTPDHGGSAACADGYDPARRMTTQADLVTCPACLEVQQAGNSDPARRPPEWVMRWLSPEVREAYEVIVLEGINSETFAWQKGLRRNVVSGRAQGARMKVQRLLAWEAQREREGIPLTDKDREPPAAYSGPGQDPLLKALGIGEDADAGRAAEASTSETGRTESSMAIRLRVQLAALRPYFDRLSRRQREIVDLYLEGRTIKEAGAQMGITHASAGSTMQNAKTKLMIAAGKTEDGPDDSGDPASVAVERLRRKLYVLQDDSRVRSKTIAPTRLSREERRASEELDYPANVARPLTREDCEGISRPCPFVSCSHHLYLDVNPETGAIKLNVPHLEVWEMAETCSLDVADRGGITLEEVGAILNLTRERIRQVEVRGLDKIRKHSSDELGLPDDRRGSALAEAIDGD